MASSARTSQPSWISSFQEQGIPGARLKLRFRLKMLLRALPESTELCPDRSCPCDLVGPLGPQRIWSALTAGCCHPLGTLRVGCALFDVPGEALPGAPHGAQPNDSEPVSSPCLPLSTACLPGSPRVGGSIFWEKHGQGLIPLQKTPRRLAPSVCRD